MSSRTGSLGAALLALAALGCAAVPPESVELSRSVSAMIASARASHLALLHRHFDAQAARVDGFMMGEYKGRFLSHVLALVRKKDPAAAGLSPDQYDAAMTRVFRTRDEFHGRIRLQREEVLRAVEGHYAMLQAAQAEVTALLRSAADLDEARSAHVAALAGRVGLSEAALRDVENGLAKGLTALDALLGASLDKIPGE